MVSRSLALAIRYIPRTSAKRRAKNSPMRFGEICPLFGAIRMVSSVAARNTQAKNIRIGSCWTSPPKSVADPPEGPPRPPGLRRGGPREGGEPHQRADGEEYDAPLAAAGEEVLHEHRQ